MIWVRVSVGSFDDGRANPDRKGPRIHVELPPAHDDEAVRTYHNRFMQLCGVGYTTLCEAIQKRAQRKAAPPRVPAAVAGAAAPGLGDLELDDDARGLLPRWAAATRPARGTAKRRC